MGSTYPDRVTAFYRDLRKKYPKARILAVSPIWDDDPAQLADISQAVRSAVRAVGGTYVDIREPLLGHHNFIVADGIHPDDAGHKAIEARQCAQVGRGLSPCGGEVDQPRLHFNCVGG